MTSSTTASNWRDEFERSFEQVRQSIDAELARARGVAEALNQSIRRMRQAADGSEVLSILVEASAPFSRRAAAIVLDGTRARTAAVRGFIAPEIQFDLNQAAAVLASIETKDPVAAATTESEFSPELCAAVLRDLETVERGYLFPIVAAGSVRAVLFALGGVEAAPLELLSETAALRLEVLDVRPKSAPPSPAARPVRAWTDLPPAEQALHLKAQRFASVKVAEMRLARPAAVREGQERGALYLTLRPEIDAARETFRKEFVLTAPAMVDYLYLELVRSLANDDDKLLGPDFPGRLI
jgi:hypothetical protein